VLGPEESASKMESVTAFVEDSALVAAVLADDSALTTFFPLDDFSALQMIFTLAALGHLLAT